MKPDWQFLARIGIIALGYFLCAWLGLHFATYSDAVTLIWPPTGIALFALLGWGMRLWPGIWLGAFFANLLVAALPAPLAAAIACGNTAGPLLAAWLLGRLRFNRDFATARDMLLFVGIGVMGGMAINASVGSVSLLASGLLPETALGHAWLTWWLGDALGALIVGPALLLWQERRLSSDSYMSGPESVLAWSGLLLVTALAATPLSPVPEGLPPLLALPFVIWLAQRGNRYAAPLATLLVCALVVWGVLDLSSPFVTPAGVVQLPRLWAFMFTMGVVSLLIVALSRQLQQTLGKVSAGQAHLINAQRIALLGSWELDLCNNRLKWSPEIYRIFEIEVQEFGASYEAFLDAVHPDDREAVKRAYEESLVNRSPYVITHRLLMKDGRVKYVDEVCYTDYAADGTPLRSVGTVQDLTERKAAERQIELDRDQQTTLRRLLETVLENGPVEATLRHYLEVLLSTSWLTLLPKGAIFLMEKNGQGLRLVASHNLEPQSLAACAHVPLGHCHCGRAAASGESQYVPCVDAHHETICPTMADHGHYNIPLAAQGRVIGVLAFFLPPGTQLDSGKMTFVTAVADILITYLIRAQAERSLIDHQANLEQRVNLKTAELVENQRRLETIIENLPQLFFMKDAEGRYTMINRKYVEETGMARDQVIGHSDREIYPLDIADAIMDWDRRAMDGTVSVTFEKSASRADGTRHDYLTTKVPLLDHQGQVSGVIGIATNISALKQLQREANAAKEEAERLARVKSEFLANMSHEIRTPLNAVLGLARIGIRENPGRKTGDTCQRIHDAGQHLLGVINDILDFSKIEAGKLKIEKRPFALVATIDSVTSFVAARAEDKGLALAVSLAPGLSEWAEGDALRLSQILTNLLSNAIKFTEQGEVRLRAARDGKDIYFRVIDSGIGMNEEQLARLFQPFEQADSSTTRTYGGTGLGLAISQSLAHLMGGAITVESSPGMGSSFILRLPMAAANAPAHSIQPAGTPTASGRRLAGLSVLAVDDVEVNRLILEDLLTHEGARTIVANDGRQALERLEEAGVSSFDVVLMDVQMPVMDGFEASRRIAAIAPGLPVIGLTAHAMAEERDKCLAAGMVEHVTKPIDVNVLVAAIQRHTRPDALAPHPSAALPGPTSVPAASVSPPPADSAIDWPALLARFSGRNAFVMKLAASACEHHADTPARLRAATRLGDREALCFIAHSLKGVSGNLEARRLHELARAVEAAMRAGEDIVEQQGHALAEALEAVLAELAGFTREQESR
ncbi:MAG: MASE1 domain-containing protein [Rhodocyclales bacterium]|nr:MASE1 domain-containing protein [Rhodocyclales bacterium]